MNKLKFIHRAHYPNNNGFTIIEVVLVLAIAGLIFLTVFLALPALQKSQRDNARRQDVGNIIASLQQYQANMREWPATSGVYLSENFTSGLAQIDKVLMRASGTGCVQLSNIASNVGLIVIAPGCTCKYSGTLDYAQRTASVQTILESGKAYCKDI